jgi:RNA polymerase sigma-70 factor (ECF subfamily)
MPPNQATSATDEAALLGRLRAGDPSAFETLVRANIGPMLAVAQRLLRHEEDARDAVQEAFLSAFRALHQFDGASRLSTWLHRIAVNAALGKIRKQKRHPEPSIEDLLPKFEDDGHHRNRPLASWGESGVAVLERKETRAQLREAIDRLPEAYRTVLLLRDIEEMDTGETARALGINEGAVKTRLHRARQALRTLLDPHLRGDQR